MNAKKSFIWWIVFILYFGGVIFAFAKGAGQDETGIKLAWIGGSILAACLGVFVAVKLNRAK